MKIFQIFLITLLTFSTVSCVKDDDSNENISQDPDINEPDPSIIGTWTLASLELTIYSISTSQQGDVVEYNAIGVGSNLNEQVIFNENPNTAISNGTHSLELTTTVVGGSITTQTFDDLTLENLLGEWTLDGDQLTFFTPLDFISNATITSLTETTLSYDSITEEVFTNSSNDNIINLINMSVSYTR